MDLAHIIVTVWMDTTETATQGNVQVRGLLLIFIKTNGVGVLILVRGEATIVRTTWHGYTMYIRRWGYYFIRTTGMSVFMNYSYR